MENFTFKEIIDKYQIVIPLIQRDYAQGRNNLRVTQIRQKFLENIKEHLMNGEMRPLRLNFIYGSERQSEEGPSFIPLDGQQRLTTLFLLHWYFCPQDQKGCLIRQFKDHNESKLSYEIRFSSKDFCSQLVQQSFNSIPRRNKTIKTDGKEKVVPYTISEDIKNEPWFIYEWNQDPTIKGMLTMLDAIEKTLGDCDRNYIWKRLVEDRCIVFNWKELDKYGLTDELYVKMNARGKELTDFDNFKSLLEEQLYQTEPEDKAAERVQLWGAKVDNDWMDVFWNYFGKPVLKSYDKSKSKEIVKEIRKVESSYYIKFIDRLVDLYICTHDDFYVPQGTGIEDIRNNALSSGILEMLPDLVKFRIFNASFFKTLEEWIDALFYGQGKEISQLVNYRNWWDLNEECSLFETFVSDNNNVRSKDKINLPHRILFYALIQFAINHKNKPKDDAYITELNEWIRIIWNLVANTTIDDNDFLPNACKTLKTLAESVYSGSGSIVQYLARNGNVGSFNKDQVAEEKKKAFLIAKDDDCWRQFILQAEDHVLFRGTIRILFADKDNFDALENFETAKNYYNAILEKFGNDGNMKPAYAANALLLINVLNNIEDYWKSINWYYRVFDNRIKTWQYILRLEFNNVEAKRDWYKSLRTVLVLSEFELNQQEIKNNWDDCVDKIKNASLLSYLSEQMPGCWVRDIHGHKAIYPSSVGIYLNMELRDQVLSYLLDNNLIALDESTGERIPHTNLYKGWDLCFDFEGRRYQWNSDNNIYLDSKWTYQSEEQPNHAYMPGVASEKIKAGELSQYVENFFTSLRNLN